MASPLEPNRFLDVSSVLDVAVAPDGERVAYVLEEYDDETAESERRTSLWLADTDGSGTPTRLTRTGTVAAPRWGPGGDRIAFLGSREGEDHGSVVDDLTEDDPTWTGADPVEKPQLWVLDLAQGGDATRVTGFPDGAQSFDWAPAGDRFVVAARDPTDEQAAMLRDRRDEDTPAPIEVTRLQHKVDGHGWTDEVETSLFVVERESGCVDRLEDATAGCGLNAILTGPQPRWSPGGNRIAFLGNHTDAGDDTYVLDVYTVRPDGSGLQKRTNSDLTASEPTWNAAGDRLAFVARDPVNWYEPTDVVVADVEADELERVSADLDRHVANAAPPRWVDDSTVLSGIADEAQARLARFDIGGTTGERVFDDLGRDRTIDAFDVAGGTAVALISDPDRGDDLYAMDAEGVAEGAAGGHVEPTRLTDLNRELLDELTFPEVHRVTAAGDEGHTIESVVATPPGFEPTGDAPLLVHIHGGPIWHDTVGFRFEDAFWTSRGYVVMHPNYRGSYGYGQAFCESIRGDWGPREVADVVAGIDGLVDEGWVDPDRVFATGFSYGGITTGWLLTRTDRLAAAAPESGVYDFYAGYGQSQWHEWTKNEFGVPWENPERFRELSSIDEIGDVDAPVLVTAGGADWNCPPTQAEQLHVSLTKAGKESKLVVYPDEPHRRLSDAEQPSYVTHRLTELATWFETHDPKR
jgi:dipeptidyl aminopeptidase/acylaminoacyl peptidase